MSEIKEIEIQPSTFKTIDSAMYRYLDEQMNLFCTTNDGWRKVPIIWVSAERSFQIKNNKDLRDYDGTIVLPAITLERTSQKKDTNFRGSVYANIPENSDYKGGSITIARVINQDKTKNFANINSQYHHSQINFPGKNKKVVYETITIPIPVYVTLMYDIKIRTEYQQQLNELLTPFITKTGQIHSFVISHENHRFEAFIQSDFNNEHNIGNMETNEREFTSTIQIKVLGYLIGEDKNLETPKIVRRENAVEIKIPRERTILDDKLEHKYGSLRSL